MLTDQRSSLLKEALQNRFELVVDIALVAEGDVVAGHGPLSQNLNQRVREVNFRIFLPKRASVQGVQFGVGREGDSRHIGAEAKAVGHGVWTSERWTA